MFGRCPPPRPLFVKLELPTIALPRSPKSSVMYILPCRKFDSEIDLISTESFSIQSLHCLARNFWFSVWSGRKPSSVRSKDLGSSLPGIRLSWLTLVRRIGIGCG